MDSAELLSFFKALADASRLKIIGLLAHQACSVEQLAAMLDLRPSTVSHHLGKLANAGLVSARAEGYYSVYSLETEALQAMARRLLSREAWPEIAGDADLAAYDRKVLGDFSHPDGRLKTIPAQRKKRSIILRHIVKGFQPGIRYPERQVNEMLGRFHEDTAMLRRELLAEGLMKRESGTYWRTKPV